MLQMSLEAANKSARCCRELPCFDSPRYKFFHEESPLPLWLARAEGKNPPFFQEEENKTHQQQENLFTRMLCPENNAQGAGGGQAFWFSLRLTVVMTLQQLQKFCLTLQLHVHSEARLKLISCIFKVTIQCTFRTPNGSHSLCLACEINLVN